jgi:hypothetical protein
MKPDICLIWMLAIIAAAIAHQAAAAAVPQVDLTEWTPPGNALGRDPFSKLCRYALMVESERLNVRCPM